MVIRNAKRLSLASLAMVSKETQIVGICSNYLTLCDLRIRAISKGEMQFNSRVPVRLITLNNLHDPIENAM